MERKYYSTVSTRLEQAEREIWDQYCAERDMKISQLIRLAVKEYIENHK